MLPNFANGSEDLTEDRSGSKRCEFQDSSQLLSGLERGGWVNLSQVRQCKKNNWFDEETHEVKEIWAALKFTTLATALLLS